MPILRKFASPAKVSNKKIGGPRAPGAPTIGSATAVTSTTATVSFTAPANDGGAVIISYTATSSPGGITGTLSQAGSGTITVSGLTTGQAYTFTVTATNAGGTSIPSSASNSITPVLVIGEAYGGGYFVGKYSSNGNGVATHNLVIAPKSSEAARSFRTPAAGSSGDSQFNGAQNTFDIVTYFGDSTTYPAAHYCNDLVVGGYSDWYLPSRLELEICYYNLKPGTMNNYDPPGNENTNAYAVPQRTGGYTTGTFGGSPASNPAQTSVTLFQDGNSEAFSIGTTGNPVYYWSSTGSTVSGNESRFKVFLYGYGDVINNIFQFQTRAMRKVAV